MVHAHTRISAQEHNEDSLLIEAVDAMPTRRYREDSLVIEPGRSTTGWQVVQIPWPEESGDFSAVVQSEIYATQADAISEAKRLRREVGGCWWVRPALV